MFRRFIPQTTSFFDFFEEHCSRILEAAKELVAMSEPGAIISARASRIRELEHEADNLTHRCINALQKTFITPFDRSDIHALISKLDDIIDAINEAGTRLSMYEITKLRPEMKAISDVILNSVTAVSEAVYCLRDLKKETDIRKACIAIQRYENDGDAVHRDAIVRLFKEETSPFEVIKWKEIFEKLEGATDRCEDVADIIQGVVIEAS